jgi:uncharacterized protein YkwD
VTRGPRLFAVVFSVVLVAAAAVAGTVLRSEKPRSAGSPPPPTTSTSVTTTSPLLAQPTSTVAPAPVPTTATTIRAVPSTTRAPTTVARVTTSTTVRVTPTTAPPAGNTAAEALALLNRDRTSRGLPALAVRADAQAKAQAWATKLAGENRIYHSNLNQGITGCTTGVGENVASASSVSLAETILMDDPPHRDNILSTRWTGVGVGVAKSAAGYVVVQVFVAGC